MANKNYADEEMTVTLELDDDSTVVCSIVTILEVQGTDYIVLLPLDENGENEDGEVYLYRYNEVDGEPELGNIEDDDEYEAAADAFDEWLDEMEFEELDVEE